jgi:hypothetical protein
MERRWGGRSVSKYAGSDERMGGGGRDDVRDAYDGCPGIAVCGWRVLQRLGMRMGMRFDVVGVVEWVVVAVVSCGASVELGKFVVLVAAVCLTDSVGFLVECA